MQRVRASRVASLGLAVVVLSLAAFSLFAAFTTRTQIDRAARADALANSYEEGTGLGLPIVRQIVHLLDGKVWATSGSGKGSVFHVQLPLLA